MKKLINNTWDVINGSVFIKKDREGFIGAVYVNKFYSSVDFYMKHPQDSFFRYITFNSLNTYITGSVKISAIDFGESVFNISKEASNIYHNNK